MEANLRIKEFGPFDGNYEKKENDEPDRWLCATWTGSFRLARESGVAAALCHRSPKASPESRHRSRRHVVHSQSPLIVSLERPQGQLTLHAVPRSATPINSPQCIHRAVIGNLAVCCSKAVIVAFPSGGHAGPRLAASRFHSASIISYVVNMSVGIVQPQFCGFHNVGICTVLRVVNRGVSAFVGRIRP